MTELTSRLRTAREQIERGEPVDWNRLAALQVLDLVILGEDFVREAIDRERSWDDAHIARIAQRSAAPL